MEKGSAAGSAAAVAAYVSETRCRRTRLLAHFGERRAGGCDPGAGEAICDCCANPVAVRTMQRAAERRAEAAFEAAAVATAEDQERQQQDGRQTQQRSWDGSQGRDAYSSDPYRRDAYSLDPYERADVSVSADGSNARTVSDAQDTEEKEEEQEWPPPPAPRPNPFCTGGQAAASGTGCGSAAAGLAPQQLKQLSMRTRLRPSGSAGAAMAAPAAPVPAGVAAATSKLPDGGLRRPFKPLVPNCRPPKKACIADGQHQKAAAKVMDEGQHRQPQATEGMQASSLPAAGRAAAAPPLNPSGLGVRRPFKPPRMAMPKSRAEP